MIAVRYTTGGQFGWLWFFTRSEEQPRDREGSRRSLAIGAAGYALPD